MNVNGVFGGELVREAERFERFLLVDWALSQAVLVTTLWLYARRGTGFARHSAAGRIGTGMLLGMVGLGIVWIVRLPFGLAAHWWERRHDLTEVSYVEWAFGDWLALGGAFVAISVALLIVMALAGRLGDHWWLPGTPVFVAIAALFTFVAPYLITDLEPLRDRQLVAAARAYERQQGLERIAIRVEDVSGTTSQANAYAAGLGPSRRVVLWNTLLDGRFTRGEEKVVLAHELGHHSSEHLPKSLAWFALFAAPAAWMLMRATRGRGGMASAQAVPLALFVVAVAQLAVAPAENWISRRMEAEADWKALQSTRDPSSARGLFEKFAETSLGDPDPPRWAYLFLSTHPTLQQRVAMADAWEKRMPG